MFSRIKARICETRAWRRKGLDGVLRQRTSKAQNSETYGMLVAAREVNSHRASN